MIGFCIGGCCLFVSMVRDCEGLLVISSSYTFDIYTAYNERIIPLFVSLLLLLQSLLLLGHISIILLLLLISRICARNLFVHITESESFGG